MSVNEFLDDSGFTPDSKGEHPDLPGTMPAESPQAGSGPAVDEVADGVCLSNTHHYSSIDSNNSCLYCPYYSFSGDFDWLEWGISIEWDEKKFDRLSSMLAREKEICQQEKKPSGWVDVEGIGALMVSRMGGNRGGDRGEHYDFKVSWGGITIGIAKRSDKEGSRPNAYVRLTGRQCLLLGGTEGYQLSRELLTTLGGKIVGEKLSRVDFCLDIAGLHARDLQEIVEKRQFITRAVNVEPKREMRQDRKTGFTAGKRPMRLVVYDKLLEVESKCDVLYIQCLIDRRWGGERPSAATRIEFQCSRPWLLKQGVDSPADLFRLQGSVIEKLTDEWFRLTDQPVDRENKNQSRANILPLWSAIQDAFARIYGEPAGPLVPIEREKITPVRLLKQARGCLRNALLQMRCECKTYAEFVKKSGIALHNLSTITRDRASFIEDYRRREPEFMT